MHDGLPPLEEIGSDLLDVSLARRASCLAMPFLTSALYFVFALGVRAARCLL